MRTSENSVKWKSNFREFPNDEVRRIPIPRTPVNKDNKKGRVPLQKHCDHCGGRESCLASDQIVQKPLGEQVPGMEPQQSS
jgi:hypothetical protein